MAIRVAGRGRCRHDARVACRHCRVHPATWQRQGTGATVPVGAVAGRGAVSDMHTPDKRLRSVGAAPGIAGVGHWRGGVPGHRDNGDSAGQTVYHFHFHIIPRFNEDFTFKPKVKNYGTGALKEYADKIRSVISKYKDIYNGK